MAPDGSGVAARLTGSDALGPLRRNDQDVVLWSLCDDTDPASTRALWGAERIFEDEVDGCVGPVFRP